MKSGKNIKFVSNELKKHLQTLEEKEEIVICANSPDGAADYLADKLTDFIPSEKLTSEELIGLRSLIFQAVSNKDFFDWEMPTLTGLTAEQFKNLANKLPKG